MKYYETVAWDQNTKVDLKNEPNFMCPLYEVFLFEIFSIDQLKNFLPGKHYIICRPVLYVVLNYELQFCRLPWSCDKCNAYSVTQLTVMRSEEKVLRGLSVYELRRRGVPVELGRIELAVDTFAQKFEKASYHLMRSEVAKSVILLLPWKKFHRTGFL